MTAHTLGSLFSGAGLLDLAVMAALGPLQPAWHCEQDPAAGTVLAHHWPGVPNHGDVHNLPQLAAPVTVAAAGYPCPGESNAGKRLGVDDPRWLWPQYRATLAAVRPLLAVGENVDAHLNRSFRHVVADLLGDGMAVVWLVLAASDVGAPHRRRRIVWLAWPAMAGDPGGLASRVPFGHLTDGTVVSAGLFGDVPVTDWPAAGAAVAGAVYALPAPTSAAAAGTLLPTARTTDTNGPGVHGDGGMDLRTAVLDLPTPTSRDHKGANQRGDATCLTGALLPTATAKDADSSGRTTQGRATGDALTDAVRSLDDGRFGKYTAAVERWETLTRPAPDPTVPRGRGGAHRLNPAFSEWMMGAPAGHVTDVPGISANAALRILGNAVVPQQLEAGIRILLHRAPADLLAALGVTVTM